MKKIVLLSQQGSGTNLLRSFLNSHPDIFIDDELFASRKDKSSPFQRSQRGHQSFLEQFYSQKGGVIGFDLKYNQINEDILDCLGKNDISVIHLLRDPARTFIKNATSDIMRKSDLKKYCKVFYKNRYKYQDLFIRGDYLEIRYEDMTRGMEISVLPNDFEHTILQWLGLGEFKDELHLTDVGKELEITY